MANKQSAANQFVRSLLTLLGEKRDSQTLGIEPGELRGAKIRATLIEEFGNTCCYCGLDISEQADVDHLIPMNKNNVGLHMMGNLVLACKTCNAKKHGDTLEEFLIKTKNPRAIEITRRLTLRAEKYGADVSSAELRELAARAYEEIGDLLSKYAKLAEPLIGEASKNTDIARKSWTQRSGHDFSIVARKFPIGSIVKAGRDNFSGEVYGYSMEHQTDPTKAHVRIISASGEKRTRVNTDLELIG